MSTEECRKCGAVVENMQRHRRWHKDLDAKLDELESDIQDVQLR